MKIEYSRNRSYLLIKARADRIPLRDNSVALVIATPPDFGVTRRPRTDFCTHNVEEYGRMLTEFLDEAVRIARPHAHILLTEGGYQGRGRRGARPIVFHVLQKNSKDRPAFHRIGSARFHTHFVRVRNFPWCALSFQLYSMLIQRYSKPGDLVAHVFSGSGNGAIAALALGRKPVLIDLHYHRLVAKRLRRAVVRTRYSRPDFAFG